MLRKALWTISVLTVLCYLFTGCASKRPSADIRLSNDSSGETISATLVGRNVSDVDIANMVKYPKLIELNLQECSQVTDAGLSQVGEIRDKLVKLSLIRTPITDDGMEVLADFKSLKDLTLAHTNVVGAGLAHLAEVPLTRLSIQSRAVKADSLVSIASLVSLEELEFHCQDVSLAAIPGLGSLTNLQSLVAFRTPVGKGGMESLRGLKQLRKLTLSSPDIDDESIDAINSLTSLEEAEFATASITSEGLKNLKLPNLKNLSLDTCSQVTDEALSNLGGMPELERLMLGGTSIHGSDLKPLADLKKLKAVLLNGNQFKGNDATIKALKELLPQCEVFIMRG